MNLAVNLAHILPPASIIAVMTGWAVAAGAFTVRSGNS